MKKHNSESIGDVLKQYLAQNEKLRMKIAESRIIPGWYALMGQGAKNYTTDIYYRQGIVFIHLNSSVLRNELMMGHDHILGHLNKYVGVDIITKIIFK